MVSGVLFRVVLEEMVLALGNVWINLGTEIVIGCIYVHGFTGVVTSVYGHIPSECE